MTELKNLFNEYKKAIATANEADAAWEKDPMNERLEAAFDAAWEKEFELYEKAIAKIVELGKGQISKGTASSMINTRFEDLEMLISKIA